MPTHVYVRCGCCGSRRGNGGVRTEVDLTALRQHPRGVRVAELEADTQWVKVNRTWLGEGNQILAAQVADSSSTPQVQWTPALWS